jgi:ATP/maltotriose-dependent transcriptional regulator MalT
VATWRIETGGGIDTGMLTDAAWVANAVFDHALAERLARRAVDAGAGMRASLALGDALNRQGRGGEARAVLEPLSALASTDQERVDVAVARYFGLTVEHGFQPEIDSVLLDAEQQVRDRALRGFLRAQRATLLSFAGKLDEGLALACSCMEAEPDEVTELRAVSPMGGVWIATGRLDAAAELGARMFEPALRHRDDVPQALLWVMTIQLSALVMAGRLREADELTSFVEAAVSSGAASAESTSFLAFARGMVALQRGQVHTARRALLEGVAGMAQTTARAHLGFPLAHLVEACALTGDVEGAIAASARADELAERVALYEGLVRRARGWAALARGGRELAADMLDDAADWAGAHGQRYAQMRALHDALRIGVRGSLAEDLLGIVSNVEGPIAHIIGAHARAAADDDAAGLEAVAEQFEQLGALLLAAEAAAQSAVAFRSSGLRGRAERAEAHAATLNEACGGARSPVLEDLQQPVPLTLREREVVRLAADGLPSNEIAERLFIATRTVEGHLQRADAKLGVNDRRSLARVLRAGRQQL